MCFFSYIFLYSYRRTFRTGYDIEDTLFGITLRVSTQDISMYRGSLSNAYITNTGVVRGKRCILPIIQIKPKHIDSRTDNTYQLMYKDEVVIQWHKHKKELLYINKALLPFGLRNKPNLSTTHIQDLLNYITTQLHRPNMNLVYIVRNVGRDIHRVIENSNSISITDNYWVKDTAQDSLTWDIIKFQKDIDKDLLPISLDGKLPLNKCNTGKTSLFTTKGHFPKATLQGYIYKRKEDAIMDYVASIIGTQIGIPIQEVSLEGNYVKIKIFTNDTTSLLHIREFKEFIINHKNQTLLSLVSNNELLKNQIIRSYIFNYLIGNMDLHDENYGFIYDSDTFRITGVAPLFDHNVSFVEGYSDYIVEPICEVSLRECTRKYAKQNIGLVQNIANLQYNTLDQFLTETQITELKNRAKEIQQRSKQ